MKKKSFFNLSFEVVYDTTQPTKSLKNYVPQAGKVLREYTEVLWTCQKFQGTGPRESFQQHMDVPRRENQETEDMDHSKPSSVCMGKKKAVEEGPRQKTVGVVLGGAAMESLYN